MASVLSTSGVGSTWTVLTQCLLLKSTCEALVLALYPSHICPSFLPFSYCGWYILPMYLECISEKFWIYKDDSPR